MTIKLFGSASSKVNPLRTAASIVMASKNITPHNNNGNGTNYEILFQKRKADASSFPSSIVFPGGVIEENDYQEQWIDYLKSFGMNDEHFKLLHHKDADITMLFDGDPIKNHIALRISAIRETFEEVGVLISKDKFICNERNIWANANKTTLAKHWQKIVCKDASMFINLFKELKCYPDIWSLHFWSNWLSPLSFKKRFNTAFFFVGFEERPKINIESNEVAEYSWMSAERILEENSKKLVSLYPPQIYEVHRLKTFKKINELVTFASERSPYGSLLYYGIWVASADGIISLLPGDELYPKNINIFKEEKIKYSNETTVQLRNRCKTLNRIETTNDNVKLWVKNLNIPHQVKLNDFCTNIYF